MGKGAPEVPGLIPEELKQGTGPAAVEVVPVEASQAKLAGDAAARGFQENEIWRWILTNDRTRARVEKRQYRSLVKRIFIPRGGAWMSRMPGSKRSATGGARWFPPNTMSLSVRESVAEALPFMPEGLPHLGKVGRLEVEMKKRHPKEPHWYLSVLSVEPESQGLGHGSALIRPGLERADAAGSGAYLETQRESNLGFYERFGFKTVEKIVIDEELPIWLMWREPTKNVAKSGMP